MVGLSLVLLLVAFRCWLALKAGVLNLLSVATASGMVALVAEVGWAGQLVGIDTPTPVPPFIPIIMFAVLFGLSMDYEVFLVFLVLIGVGMASAIAVDATIVRMVLVPAVMQILGDRSGWLPGWLNRLIPRAELEPARG